MYKNVSDTVGPIFINNDGAEDDAEKGEKNYESYVNVLMKMTDNEDMNINTGGVLFW